MDLKIAQKRVDDLSAAMLAKGMAQPEATLMLTSNGRPCVLIKWADASQRFGSDTEVFNADTVAEAFDMTTAFIAKRPNAEQARLHEFMRALGKVIDLGRQHNIEVEFLNPLVATMKTLSENIITDQRAA